ncbi:TPA: CPBP family intramembrane metalloprotease, partial [Klebsiella pneumoniae]|nr:CPBP family intramembrane metalloprotease [Klebsiella pneumoniae]
NSPEIMSRGLLAPMLFILEFIILVPLYYLFFRKRDGLGIGTFNLKLFFILFFIIIFIQFMVPYLLGFRKAESWSTSQISYEHYIFWINVLPAIFIVPIYEEIVFRGCLFNSFKFWFNGNVYGSAVVTSFLFAVMHLQYSDIRTFVMLFLVSLTLIVARVKSNGILMPILLHMLMNVVVIGVQYLVYINHAHQ